MDKIKKIITSPLFMALLSGLVGGLLLADGNDMYGGISIGIGIVLFLNAFKSL
tara:strand:- start:529 stop:687 length:159 start_codon:yes stop_codon:yes gene_type:complete